MPSTEESSKHTISFWIAILVIVLILAFALWKVYSSESTIPEHLDDSFCPEDRSPPAQYVLIVDATDSLNAVTRQSAKSKINKYIEEAKDTSEFQMFLVTGDTATRAGVRGTTARSRFRICKPSRTGPNPRLLEDEYQNKFLPSFWNALDSMMGTEIQPMSPIVKTIHTAAEYGFSADLTDSTDRHLLIVSDMMQHTWTPALTFVDGPIPDFADFSKLPLYRELMAKLANAEVTVLLVPREEQAGKAKAIKIFWDKYFYEQGADTVYWQDLR